MNEQMMTYVSQIVALEKRVKTLEAENTTLRTRQDEAWAHYEDNERQLKENAESHRVKIAKYQAVYEHLKAQFNEFVTQVNAAFGRPDWSIAAGLMGAPAQIEKLKSENDALRDDMRLLADAGVFIDKGDVERIKTPEGEELLQTIQMTRDMLNDAKAEAARVAELEAENARLRARVGSMFSSGWAGIEEAL